MISVNIYNTNKYVKPQRQKSQHNLLLMSVTARSDISSAVMCYPATEIVVCTFSPRGTRRAGNQDEETGWENTRLLLQTETSQREKKLKAVSFIQVFRWSEYNLCYDNATVGARGTKTLCPLGLGVKSRLSHSVILKQFATAGHDNTICCLFYFKNNNM